nr:unnamed protein product [Callosobruchus analis]
MSCYFPYQKLNIRTKIHNIVKVLLGLKCPSKCGDKADPLQIWSFLFTEEMENKIILCTVEKMLLVQQMYTDPDTTEVRELTKKEFRAFIAILYYSAVFMSNDEDLDDIFSTNGTGPNIFRCILSLKRVQALLTCLRFHNPEDRESRKSE